MATGDHGVAFLAAVLLVVEDFKSGWYIDKVWLKTTLKTSSKTTSLICHIDWTKYIMCYTNGENSTLTKAYSETKVMANAEPQSLIFFPITKTMFWKLFVSASSLRKTAARQWEEIKDFLTSSNKCSFFY